MIKKLLSLMLTIIIMASFSVQCLAEQETADDTIEEMRWWENYPRFIGGINFDDYYANAATAGDLWNAGQGTYYVNHSAANPNRLPAIAVEKTKGQHRMAWVELQGDSRCMIGAVNNVGDGKYAINPGTGQPDLIADPWSWNNKGPSVNPAANEAVWISAAAMVNREPWQGDFVWPEDAMQPTYPDGTSALGWLSDNHKDPRNYKLYDAMAQKDINGDLRINEANWLSAPAETDPNTLYGPVVPQADGSYRYTINFYFSKDVASPWWLEYNRIAVRQLLQEGVEGFWVDNYAGWDYINSQATAKGFGEWSVALFRDYIKEHNDVLKIENPDEFDIRVYLKDKFREKFPDKNPDVISDSGWNNEYWLDDIVWKAYKAFKCDVAYKAMQDFYTMVKEEAKNLGLDPNEILVSGNDITHLSFGSEKGTYIDVVSTEHSTLGWSPDKRFYCDGIAPEGQSATSYKTMLAYQHGPVSAPWYYMSADFIPYDGLADIEYYTGLANNAIIKTGGGRAPGTLKAQYNFNKNVERFGNMFKRRYIDAKVAMVHSPQTQSSYWIPFETPFNGMVAHTLDFGGWGCVLEENNVSYKILSDYQIDDEHLADIELLILPTITCIDDEEIEAIRRYADRGGKLIISGSDSGLQYTSDNIWQNRERPVLADMAQEEKYKDTITYFETSIGMDYYIHKNSMYNVDKSFDYLFTLDTTYQVGTPAFTNSDEEKVTGMAGLDKLTTTFTLKNNDMANIDVTIYAAIYNKDGVCVDVVSKDCVARANVVETLSIDVDLPEKPEDYSVNVHLWKGLKPIAVPITFPMMKTQKEMTTITTLENETEQLIDSGFIPRRYKLYGFNSYMRSTLFEQEDGEKYFLDLVNANYDLDTDTVISVAGGIVDLELDKDAEFFFYDADKQDGVKLKAERDGAIWRIEVPKFRVYGSIEIKLK